MSTKSNVARQHLKIMGCKLQKAPSLPCRGLESCAAPAACMESISALRWMIANTTRCQGEPYASSQFLGAQNDDTMKS